MFKSTLCISKKNKKIKNGYCKLERAPTQAVEATFIMERLRRFTYCCAFCALIVPAFTFVGATNFGIFLSWFPVIHISFNLTVLLSSYLFLVLLFQKFSWVRIPLFCSFTMTFSVLHLVCGFFDGPSSFIAAFTQYGTCDLSFHTHACGSKRWPNGTTKGYINSRQQPTHMQRYTIFSHLRRRLKQRWETLDHRGD